MGSAVAETVAAMNDKKARVIRLGMPDKFGVIAEHFQLLADFGLNAKGVCNTVEQLL